MVCVASSKSDLLPARVGLRQGCPTQTVASPVSSGFGIPSLPFADDVVLVSSSNSDPQLALEWFAAKCETAGMRRLWVNTGIVCGSADTVLGCCGEERAEPEGKALSLPVNTFQSSPMVVGSEQKNEFANTSDQKFPSQGGWA